MDQLPIHIICKNEKIYFALLSKLNPQMFHHLKEENQKVTALNSQILKSISCKSSSK